MSVFEHYDTNGVKTEFPSAGDVAASLGMSNVYSTLVYPRSYPPGNICIRVNSANNVSDINARYKVAIYFQSLLLATSNIITSGRTVHRFDFPGFDTYTLGETSSGSTTKITSGALSTIPTIYGTYNDLNVSADLDVKGVLTGNNVTINGTLTKPNQVFFSASRSVFQDDFFAPGYLVYDVVDENVGYAYNGVDGKFLTDITGVYFISVGFYSNGDNSFAVDVYKNDTTTLDRC